MPERASYDDRRRNQRSEAMDDEEYEKVAQIFSVGAMDPVEALLSSVGPCKRCGKPRSILSGRRGYPPDCGRLGHLPAAGEALGARRSAIPGDENRGRGQSAFRGIRARSQAL